MNNSEIFFGANPTILANYGCQSCAASQERTTTLGFFSHWGIKVLGKNLLELCTHRKETHYEEPIYINS